MDYELTDFEWAVIVPLLPNTPLGVARVDDRHAMNGIFWTLRTSALWRALSEEYGPRTTCYNRFVRSKRLEKIRRELNEEQNPPKFSKLELGRLKVEDPC